MTLPSIADITVRLTLSGSLPARSVCHRINSETASDRIDDTAHKIGELGKKWGADLTPKEAGAGTGTYGLFRDLAAPFGVAVFVPLFTNQITDRIHAGSAAPDAAVASIHFLAMAELLCVALGIAAVLFLPKGKKN